MAHLPLHFYWKTNWTEALTEVLPDIALILPPEILGAH
jgi:hypothetical protein